jgi:hypothetical protein
MASWHPKQHATFRILDYRKYLAYFIIVVSGKGSERRMPKLWIECEAGADTADKKKGEPEERPHLQKKNIDSILKAREILSVPRTKSVWNFHQAVAAASTACRFACDRPLDIVLAGRHRL